VTRITIPSQICEFISFLCFPFCIIPKWASPRIFVKMSTNLFSRVFIFTVFIVLASCAKEVKDALDETTLSLQCANLVREFDERNDADSNRNCTEIVGDINEIESTCSDFLSDSTKESFAQLRAACENN